MKNKTILIIVAIILIILTFIIIFKKDLLRKIYPQDYKELIDNYAQQYSVDKNLIFAVIKAESNFKEEAVSNKGAIGLMQIMEETAKETAKTNNISIDFNNFKEELKKVENNINIGTKYLSKLLEKYQNKELALAAYNAGIGTVDNWIEKGIIKPDGSDIENIPYKETNNYIRKILRDYKIYCDIYNIQ